jgi:hypothetical protein
MDQFDGRFAADRGHQRRAVAIPNRVDLRGCGVDFAQIVGGELHACGTDILLEPVQLGRARDGHDVAPLGQQPRQRDLGRRCALLPGDPLQQVDERLVLLHRFRGEAWNGIAEILRRQLRVLVDRAGEKAPP